MPDNAKQVITALCGQSFIIIISIILPNTNPLKIQGILFCLNNTVYFLLQIHCRCFVILCTCLFWHCQTRPLSSPDKTYVLCNRSLSWLSSPTVYRQYYAFSQASLPSAPEPVSVSPVPHWFAGHVPAASFLIYLRAELPQWDCPESLWDSEAFHLLKLKSLVRFFFLEK